MALYTSLLIPWSPGMAGARERQSQEQNVEETQPQDLDGDDPSCFWSVSQDEKGFDVPHFVPSLQ